MAGLGRVPMAALSCRGPSCSSVVGAEIAGPCHSNVPRGNAIDIIHEALHAKTQGHGMPCPWVEQPMPTWLSVSPRETSHYALIEHGIGDLDKSADVGALDVVDVILALLAVLDAGRVNGLHDAPKSAVDLLARPRQPL